MTAAEVRESTMYDVAKLLDYYARMGDERRGCIMTLARNAAHGHTSTIRTSTASRRSGTIRSRYHRRRYGSILNTSR